MLTSRNWIYVDDCAEALRRVCEHGKLGEIYNVGTDSEWSNYDVTMHIHQMVAKYLKRFS